MSPEGSVPIDVRHLFRSLDQKLIALLESLKGDEWNQPTVAQHWNVKEVVAHLLDGNIRALSTQRDQYFGETMPPINNDRDMVNWLNQLNADWVNATRRASSAVLVLLHKATGTSVSDYYESLDLGGGGVGGGVWGACGGRFLPRSEEAGF